MLASVEEAVVAGIRASADVIAVGERVAVGSCAVIEQITVGISVGGGIIRIAVTHRGLMTRVTLDNKVRDVHGITAVVRQRAGERRAVGHVDGDFAGNILQLKEAEHAGLGALEEVLIILLTTEELLRQICSARRDLDSRHADDVRRGIARILDVESRGIICGRDRKGV